MRLLIDECLPRALKRLLPEHTCCTVQEMAWAGIKNGALLSLAEAEFDALITIDQGFAYQQDLKERRIAILLLVSRSNQIEDLVPRSRCSYRTGDDPAGPSRANRPVVIFRGCLGGAAKLSPNIHISSAVR
jgi:predicted nuclease of predicted toxin-antitoxin system